MKAIVLVAGYASRLYPLTLNTPKALLTLNNITMLDFLMNKIDEIDTVDEVILVSNDKFYNQFISWSYSYLGNKKITILNDGTTSNETRLGAIGDMQFAIEKLDINDDIIVLASDNYFTFSLKDFYDFYLEKQSDCVIVTEFEDLEYLGKNLACLKIDNNNKITSMVEKPGGIPDTNLGAYACHIYTKETIKMIKLFIDEGNNKDAPGYFATWLYTKKPIYAYMFDGECYDIGTFEVYNMLQEKLSKKQ